MFTTAISRDDTAEFGADYTARFIGAKATHVCWDGEVLTGTVEAFDGIYPIIRFADGRWARGVSGQTVTV
jgi:hypothetical protein